MIVFVIVGMPASGKNIAREYAVKHGIPYFATGDIIREELKKQGLEANAANTAVISTRLRGSDGMGVTRVALSAALMFSDNIVFMEGMRSWPEIELIRKQTDCVVVAFVAPRELRKNASRRVAGLTTPLQHFMKETNERSPMVQPHLLRLPMHTY
jgi:dephospho-CoA kinase